jgi:hypothetical protein
VIDSRLQEHWRRLRAAREQLRESLPPSWQSDPRPEMDEVRETYVEGILQMQSQPISRMAAFREDDR